MVSVMSTVSAMVGIVSVMVRVVVAMSMVPVST